MLFNSFEFLRFFLVVLIFYYLPPMRRSQTTVLLVSSCFFYAAKDVRLLPLLLFSIAGNSLLSSKAATSRRWVSFGVVANLVLLALFKYGALLGRTFLPANSLFLHRLGEIPLPVGISFFTFEGISILVDCARYPQLARLGPWQLARKASLLIAFFPHLVAGPILKAHEFFPQIECKSWRDIDWEYCFRSLVLGYFLKMVVADHLKELTFWMTYPYFLGLPPQFLAAMLVGYSMQIFADFAGYSLIALGLAGLLGYRIPDNFRFPYLASSFSEFWTRWHISLSSFLREYLYIPLGGNRQGARRTYRNLLVVMILGGLWHGAAWSYAIWGLMHGLALALERWMGQFVTIPNRGVGRVLRVFLVFSYVTLAWLLFRLPDFHQAIAYVQAMCQPGAGNWKAASTWAILLYSSPVLFYHATSVFRPGWLQRLAPLYYGLMLCLILTNSGPSADFIYFQF